MSFSGQLSSSHVRFCGCIQNRALVSTLVVLIPLAPLFIFCERASASTVWGNVARHGLDPSTPYNSMQYRVSSLAYDGEYVYAGTMGFDGAGCQVWRGPDTSYNPNSWTQINTNVFGDTGVYNATAMTFYNGNLVVGIERSGTTNRSAVWRWDGSSSWTNIAPDIFTANDYRVSSCVTISRTKKTTNLRSPRRRWL
jgi:hypothetical protein